MRRRKRRSIYLLPNLLTSASLFAGFYSIIATIDKKFTYAAIAILISGVFDCLDGRVARLTKSMSRFGVEYDSLSDLIAFGVAPGILAYMWALKGYGRFGWVAAFLFVVCGALRLARFNIQVETSQKKNFLGLPIPAAASVIAASVLFSSEMGYKGELKTIVMPILIYALAFLMVSNVRYYSFKDLAFVRKRPFRSTVMAITGLVIVCIEPEIAFFVLSFGYALSGPLYTVIRMKKIRAEEAALRESQAEKGGHQ
jgi:CDP-diacylglycerol--serine O-phosphatidyltransferase